MLRDQLTKYRRMVANLPTDLDQLTSNVRQILTNVQNLLILHAGRKRVTGTILVLWSHEGAPCCVSEPVEFDPGIDNMRRIESLWSIPAGAWVVGIGCTIGGVYVGNECQDLGPRSRSPVVILRDRVGIGTSFHVRVKE